MNEFGQLGLPEEISSKLIFFPDFLKVDFFRKHNLFVLDASIGFSHTLVLVQDIKTNTKKVFGCGRSNVG